MLTPIPSLVSVAIAELFNATPWQVGPVTAAPGDEALVLVRQIAGNSDVIAAFWS